MAQSTILVPGTSAATSTDITVPAKEVVTVGIYAAADASLPAGVAFAIRQATPGADITLGTLTSKRPSVQLPGPGTYSIARPAYDGPAFGVFLDEAD